MSVINNTVLYSLYLTIGSITRSSVPYNKCNAMVNVEIDTQQPF